MPSPFRLIVFDLDGTLVDSRRDLAESVNQLIREYGGRQLDEDVVGRLVGEGVRRWVPRALEAAGISSFPLDAIDRFISIYQIRLLNHTRAYDGIPEMLAHAAAVAELAVLTNKLRPATVKLLEGLGLARFFTRIGGAEGPYPPKPAPQGLQALMTGVGVTPTETLLVGDSPIDLQTARNAGVPICLARYGYGFVDMSPEISLGTLSALSERGVALGGVSGAEIFIDRPEDLLAILTSITP
jgi:phosphoglycolate phosphatase